MGSVVVGIDLGTTHSLVAVMRGARPEIIPNRAGQRLTPSVVGIDDAGRVVVGEAARSQLKSAPDRTIAEVKRLMGSGETVTLAGRSYTPQEISGFILKALRDDASNALGTSIREAVVTVPAYFTDAQRQATKDAGALAGLKVERIINEPTAAALAYGIDRLDAEEHVLVYDLGGGTFDVSVLEMFSGVLDVRATSGNARLGGADFDHAVAEWLRTRAEKRLGVDLRQDRVARARLKAAAEAAKIELSDTMTARVSLELGGGRVYEDELDRATLEVLIGGWLRSTLDPVRTALVDAKLTPQQITEVVLVGGSSRIPMVHRLLTELFGKPPRGGVHPDEAVALGAAIQAGIKTGVIAAATGIMIADVAPFTLGVEVVGSTGREQVSGLFSPIIPRNAKVPISRTRTYQTTASSQRVVDIRIFQGEDRFVKNNVFLDAYTVDGLPPKPAGEESVEVTFSYDINGILNVKTRVTSTGKEASLSVDRSASRLSPLEREEARARLEREWQPTPEVQGWVEKARTHAAAGRLDDAILYGEAAASASDEGWLHVAELCEQNELYDRALRAYGRELRRTGRDPSVVASRDALLLRLGLGATVEALSDAPAGPLADAAEALFEGRDATAHLARASDAERAHPTFPVLAGRGPTPRARLGATPAEKSAAAVGRIGVMAWTPRGGAVSPLQAVAMRGEGKLFFTGNVHDTGREAGALAYSLLRSRASALGIDGLVLAYDLHLHYADFEVSKEGHSSGLALTLAGLSALTRRALRGRLAVTGAVDLDGSVVRIDGVYEKIVAARLAGVTCVLHPSGNTTDVARLPDLARAGVQLIAVSTIDEAIHHAFARAEGS